MIYIVVIVITLVVESKGIGGVLDCSKCSSLDKLLRITSYLLRFIFNLRTKQKNSNDYRSGDLSTEQIVISKEHWVKYEQLFIANSDKYDRVKSSLRLYYDKKGILRLNTRISNVENFNFEKKFRILLRSDSHFTQLVIHKVHEKHLNCGRTLSLWNKLYLGFYSVKLLDSSWKTDGEKIFEKLSYM